MDIRTLRYFLAVAQEGNITKAAQMLHITQPTLSRQLMELEDELNTPLLIRGKRQVTLTDSGLLFQQRAKEMLAQLDKTIRDISNHNTLVGGTVAIGCVETNAAKLLAEVIDSFSKTYPSVQYELYNADGDDIREKLDRGSIDIGLLVEPIETSKYDFFRLPIQETWGILMRADDPMARKETIHIQDILDLPLITPRRSIVQSEIATWLGAPDHKLTVFASHNLMSNTLLLVERKLGYMIIVKSAFTIRENDAFCFVPFHPTRTSGHVLVWRKNQLFNSATSLFIQHIKELFPE